MDTQANPLAFKPGQRIIVIGNIFATPLAVQGASGLPVNQLFFWLLFTWRSMSAHPSWSWYQHGTLGGLKMLVLLGSEWCHNLAHVAAARAVGKPVDALRIILGMPVIIYNEPEHPSINPRQHIIRSSAGPVCNAALLLVCKLLQGLIPGGSPAREVVDTAAGMNAFITGASLLPIPAFDGGPILKWTLIERGYSPPRAAAVARRANQVIGASLSVSAAAAMRKRRWLSALIFALLGLLSLTTGLEKIDSRP